MINTVVKFENNVIVLDEKGEQILEYQGNYDQVKDKILRDAPLSASFYHAAFELQDSPVPREEW